MKCGIYLSNSLAQTNILNNPCQTLLYLSNSHFNTDQPSGKPVTLWKTNNFTKTMSDI